MIDLPWLEITLAFVAGLCFGSFATVLCYRIPREIPLGLVSHQRSACPHCKKKIAWYRNVPLFTYLLQKGRCKECGARIGWHYPVIELTTGVLFAFTYALLSRSSTLPMDSTARWLEIAKTLYFVLSLIVIVPIDIEFRIIPDRFSLGNWVIALGASFLWGSPSPFLSLTGCAFGFGSFFLMAWAYEKWKGVEGLGFGDVKMMGWIGAWLGVFSVPFVILSASVTGLIVGILAMRGSKDGLQTAIPFGPFLALGAYVAWVLQSFDIL